MWQLPHICRAYHLLKPWLHFHSTVTSTVSSPPQLGNDCSAFYVYESHRSRSLIKMESCNIDSSVSDLFHFAQHIQVLSISILDTFFM